MNVTIYHIPITIHDSLRLHYFNIIEGFNTIGSKFKKILHTIKIQDIYVTMSAKIDHILISLTRGLSL